MEKTRTCWLLAVFAACLLARGDAFSFMTQNQEVVVLEGDTAVIKCEVANLGERQIVFWLNGSNVMAMAHNVFNSDSGRVEIAGVGSVYDLVITNVRLGDEGSYTCQIAGPDGTIQQKNMLTVNIPPYIELSPNLDEVDMDIGEKIILQCDAEGKPVPDVVWMLPDQGNVMRGDVDGGHLELSNIQKENAGEYTCTASNGAGNPVSRSIHIHVNYPPTVHVEKPTIYTGPGHEVSIECIFDANPVVSVIWTHNGTDIDFDQRQNIGMAEQEVVSGVRQVLRITNLQPFDLGLYRCDGGNDRGTAYEDIVLSALPSELAIVSKKTGKYSDQYTLKWHVMSVAPIIDFQFMFKKVNSTGPSKWQNSTIPSSKSQYMLPLHQEEKVLKNLAPNGTYVVRLCARNAYGQTEWSERFRFMTSDEVAPLPTDSEPKSGQDTDQQGGDVVGTAATFTSTSFAALVLTVLSLLLLA